MNSALQEGLDALQEAQARVEVLENENTQLKEIEKSQKVSTRVGDFCAKSMQTDAESNKNLEQHIRLNADLFDCQLRLKVSDEKVEMLTNKLSQKEKELEQKAQYITDCEQQLKESEAAVSKLCSELISAKEEMCKKTQYITDCEQWLKERSAKIDTLTKKLCQSKEELKQKMEHHEQELKERDSKINLLTTEAGFSKVAELCQKEETDSEFKKRESRMNERLSSYQQRLSECQLIVRNLTGELTRVENEMEQKTLTIREWYNRNEILQKQLKDRETQVNGLTCELNFLKHRLNQQTQCIANCQEDVKNSEEGLENCEEELKNCKEQVDMRWAELARKNLELKVQANWMLNNYGVYPGHPSYPQPAAQPTTGTLYPYGGVLIGYAGATTGYAGAPNAYGGISNGYGGAPNLDGRIPGYGG